MGKEEMKKSLTKKMLLSKENEQNSALSEVNDCFCSCLVSNFPSKNGMETEVARPFYAPANTVFQIKKNRQGCITLACLVWTLFFFFSF